MHDLGSHRPIRVLFAIPALDHGGPDRVFFEVINGLDRAAFLPSVIVTKSIGHYLRQLPGDVEIHIVDNQRSFFDRYPVWPTLRHIYRAHPDVVIATQGMVLTLGVVASLFPKKTRFVVRQANDVTADFASLAETSLLKHRLARSMTLAVLRRADAVICQSAAMKADIERLLETACRHLHVIPNPIDTRRILHSLGGARVTLPGRPALVSVGRLAPQKGFDILLEAVAQLRTRHPHLHLTILGDGPERGMLETKARVLGLVGTVTFAGFTPSPVPQVNAANLFVLASRYEGFPNAALEALACGTPIVLTNCPGANSQLVRPGKNGQLAASATPTAFATALDVAITELPDYDRMKIRADCANRFDATRVLRAYEQTIFGLIRTEKKAR